MNIFTVLLAVVFSVTRVNFHHFYSNNLSGVMQELLETDDPYATLGMSWENTQDELRARYKVLAMELHPDKNRDDPDATEKFAEVNSAWNQLKNPEDRAFYDTYYGFLIIVKKLRMAVKKINKPVIVLAKMMGLPDPEENFLNFDYLQYGYGFAIAFFGQVLLIESWTWLVPGFIKRLIWGIIWAIWVLPFKICWWFTKFSLDVSWPGIMAVCVFYNAWMVFPRAEAADHEYLGRIFAFLSIHYLLFLRTDRWWTTFLKWTVMATIEAWLIGSETKSIGEAKFHERWAIRHLFNFPEAPAEDVTKA